MIITGAHQINLFRMRTLLIGLRAEATSGMKLTRGRSCYSIVKSEFNLKGNKASVYNQFVQIYNDQLAQVSQ